MAGTGVMDLATGVGGRIKKEDVDSTVKKYYAHFNDEEEAKKNDYKDVVNKYYDLVTSFYEFGWGESFHFATRWKGDSLKESFKRYQHFLALQLGLKRGMKVLDVGCGIGGPLREIHRLSLASITGLNNNEYQIARANVLNDLAGVGNSCNYVKADFMKMPFPDSTFDAIYCIDATCYATDIVACYREIYRVLKPGQCFTCYEWCLTDNYNPDNDSHKKIKEDIQIGVGILDIRTTHQCLNALKQVGFEVIWERDIAIDSPLPWYLPLDTSHFSFSDFHFTAIGRFLTRTLVKVLEYAHLAPAGSIKVLSILEIGANGLLNGGRKGIFTPMYSYLVRKPLPSA